MGKRLFDRVSARIRYIQRVHQLLDHGERQRLGIALDPKPLHDRGDSADYRVDVTAIASQPPIHFLQDTAVDRTD